MEAFTSRSRTELQPLQAHSRSLSVSSLLIAPQLEQVFEDGANLHKTVFWHDYCNYKHIQI